MSKHPHIVQSDTLQWTEQSHGERFQVRRKALAAAAGGEKLGCSVYELPPGKKGWPYHFHYANEEAIFVLEGTGILRLNDEEFPIAAGDYIALPAGSQNAHQVMNPSENILKYLCFSTMIEPDVMGYPDSGKIGVFAGAAPGGAKEKRTLSKFFPNDAEVDYWRDEK